MSKIIELIERHKSTGNPGREIARERKIIVRERGLYPIQPRNGSRSDCSYDCNDCYPNDCSAECTDCYVKD